MQSVAIKYKVIFAFTAIGVLMLLSSGFFYWSLGKISVANSDIETLAVPVQQQSNALQLSLLSITKFNAVAFSQSKIAKLVHEQKQTDSEQKLFNDKLAILELQLQDQPKMQSLLVQIDDEFQRLVTTNTAMFSAKQSGLDADSTLASQSTQYIEEITSLSNDLLDLELLQVTREQQATLDAMVGTATRIDDLLFTLSNNLKSIKHISSLATLDEHQQDASFLLDNVKSNFNYLKRQASELNDAADFSALTEKMNTVNEKLGTIYQPQKTILTSRKDAESAFNSFQQQFQETEKLIIELNQLADERFASLQKSAQSTISTGSSLAVIISIILLSFAALISVLTTRAMLKPLNAVNKALARIASGDLSKRTHPRSNDEFGTLFVV